MSKGKPRDRIVEIKRILTKPRVMKEMDDYAFFSLGIQMTDGTYANISLSATDEEEFMKKAHDCLVVDKLSLEEIKVGGKYKLYEESTDEEQKYWNVKAFVKINPEPNVAQEGVAKGSGGASSPSTQEKPQETMYAVQQKKIIRQTVLKVAAEACAKESTPQKLMEYAERLEEWVNRK